MVGRALLKTSYWPAEAGEVRDITVCETLYHAAADEGYGDESTLAAPTPGSDSVAIYPPALAALRPEHTPFQNLPIVFTKKPWLR